MYIITTNEQKVPLLKCYVFILTKFAQFKSLKSS